MNRSGTSALAAALQQLGVYFGIPEHFSSKGLRLDYDAFENEQVVQICNSLLNAFEMGSIPCRSLPQDWLSYADIPDDVYAVANFTSNYFSGHPLWGWKVPSASLLVPFFEAAFDQAGTKPAYLLTIRHPLEVASGLFERQGIPVAEGIGFWVHYLLTVLTQCDPNRLFLVPYRQLVENPRQVLEPVWTALNLQNPSQADWDRVRSAVRPELDRNQKEGESLPSIASNLWRLLSEASRLGRIQNESATFRSIQDLNSEWKEWLELTRMPTTSHCRIQWRTSRHSGSDHFRGEREWHSYALDFPQSSIGTVEIRFMPLFGIVYVRNIRWQSRNGFVPVKAAPGEGAFSDFASDGTIRICTFGESPHISFEVPESIQDGNLTFELQFVVGKTAATEIAQRLAKAYVSARSVSTPGPTFKSNPSLWGNSLSFKKT